MQQKYLCFLAIFYLVLFSMKTAAAAGEAEFYLEPMIVTAARYDNSAGKPGYYKVDEKKLENGSIVLDEEPVLPARVEILEDTQILLHIQEGRFHQVKRMLHAIGNEVVHLKRIAMGPLRLDEALASGEWRYLSEEEITALKNVA